MASTHEVTNQPPPLTGHDVYAGDLALVESVRRRGGPGPNASPPVLRTHDRYGNRIDEVDFHPAYHRLLGEAVRSGLAGAPWAAAGPTPHTSGAAGFLVWSQVEAGHGCPVSMSYSVLPALQNQPDLAAAYGPGLST